MLYHNVRVMAHYLRIVDAVTVGAVSAATWWLGTRVGAWPWQPTWEAMIVFSSLAVLAFMALGVRLRTYHAWRTQHILQELLALGEVLAYSAGIAAVGAEILTSGLPGGVYLAAIVGAAAALLGLRVGMRVLIRRLRRRGEDYRVWLVVGDNARSARLVKEIRDHPHYGIHIDEVVDLPDRNGASGGDAPARATLGGRVVPDVEAVRAIVASRVIDEVVVTLPLRSHYDAVWRILEVCREAGISVKLPPDTFADSESHSAISLVGGIPLVTRFTGPSNHAQLAAKRVIDVIGAGTGLLLLLPLLGAIAAAVKLTSRGPVFFRQTRVGLHGRRFQMVKFRSMIEGAAGLRDTLAPRNETDGTAFKIKDDPRITAIGRVLRKFYLDEIPQLWNVLVGDMSLVGPRPLPPLEAEGNEWWQRRRLSVPAGITCSFQIKGHHHKLPFREWMRLDLAYIDNWSVGLDLRLLAGTFTAVLRGTGW